MKDISSKKRSYQIFLSDKLFERTSKFLKGLEDTELQNYIDRCFQKANHLGSSRKSGAWSESGMYRDKAKMAIIEKENRRG